MLVPFLPTTTTTPPLPHHYPAHRPNPKFQKFQKKPSPATHSSASEAKLSPWHGTYLFPDNDGSRDLRIDGWWVVVAACTTVALADVIKKSRNREIEKDVQQTSSSPPLPLSSPSTSPLLSSRPYLYTS